MYCIFLVGYALLVCTVYLHLVQTPKKQRSSRVASTNVARFPTVNKKVLVSKRSRAQVDPMKKLLYSHHGRTKARSTFRHGNITMGTVHGAKPSREVEKWK